MSSSLLVRADGGPGIGSGHLARSFALAEEWVRRGHRAVLVSNEPPHFWSQQFQRAGIEVLAKPDPRGCFDWVAVDGYALQSSQVAATRVLRIDDFGRSPSTPRGWVLDQNLGSGDAVYPNSTRRFIGPRYAMIRRHIRDAASSSKASPDSHGKLLIAVGGAPSSEVRSAVEEIVADPALSQARVTVLDGTTDPVTAMRSADAAVVAAGSTVWELCLVGVPMVLLVVADNQREVAAALVDAGAALMGGTVPGLDSSAVAATTAAVLIDRAVSDPLVAAESRLVDGRGPGRVVSAMLGDLISLRPATWADTELVHRWNNESAVRQASFNQDPIPWEDHERWMATRLEDTNSFMYIGSVEGSDLGLVRFQVTPGEAVAGVVIGPEHRGQGWASALIDAGCCRLRHESTPTTVTAQIRPGNSRSVEAFLAADFDASPSAGARTAQPELLEFTRILR